MAMTEGKISYATLADFAGIAEHTGLAIGLQRRVRGVKGADAGRYGAWTIVCGEQDPRRARVLQLNKVGFILDLERFGKPVRERMIAVAHINAKFAIRRMRQKKTSE